MTAKVPCSTCGGKGTVTRVAPTLADGNPDPRYIASKFPALCPSCDGSGVVPDKVARAQNIAAAKAADGS